MYLDVIYVYIHSKIYVPKKSKQNLAGSLTRGMPTVVDESVEVRVRKPDGDTERVRHRLNRFGPSA